MRFVGIAVACSLMAGCGLGVTWQNHISLRSVGGGLGLGQVDPQEPLRAVIRTNLDYMTISIDSVFVRNLAGIGKKSVALGLEVRGILPGGKALQTVLDVKASAGDHGFLSFDNAAVIRPFLYTGQNLTIGLHFRAVGKGALENVKGRIAGAGDVIKRLHPSVGAGLETASDLFKTIIGAVGKLDDNFKYEFTLYPADSVYRDKPDMLLTATRHILLILPPPGAPSDVRKLSADKLMRHLRMRGNRLVWRHDKSEYTETPYVVLNITRFRRYPATDTELRKLAARIDRLIEEGDAAGAKALLPLLGVAIGDDKVITTREKNLERSWKDYREAKIASLEAEKSADHKLQLSHTEKQLQHLHHIRSQFAKILYPYEVKQLDDMVARLTVTAGMVAKDNNLPVAGIAALARVYKEASRKLVEKPPPPPPERKLVELDLTKDPPPPKPTWKRIYHKWWFWTLVSVGVAGAAGALGATLGQSTPQAPEFAYPSHTVGIPAGLRGVR